MKKLLKEIVLSVRMILANPWAWPFFIVALALNVLSKALFAAHHAIGSVAGWFEDAVYSVAKVTPITDASAARYRQDIEALYGDEEDDDFWSY